jgi:hypothetical protein
MNKLHFKYITDEDIKRETLELVSNIKEEDKSIFVFNDESLYETKGHGHDFVYGFYQEYVTKSGIRANRYTSGCWIIGNDSYFHKDGNFELIPKPEVNEISFDNLSFPLAKQVHAKAVSTDLISVTPMQYGK